jgi:hypothetical protein
LRKSASRQKCRVGTLTVELIIVLCLRCLVGMGTLSGQSTSGVSSDTTMAQSPRSAAEPETLGHDILQKKVPLSVASTVTESTVVQHEERPFRRKPRKDVFVGASASVLIMAFLAVAVILAAGIRRRHALHDAPMGSVTTHDSGNVMQIESPFSDEQFDAASEDARAVEESCQPH